MPKGLASARGSINKVIVQVVARSMLRCLSVVRSGVLTAVLMVALFIIAGSPDGFRRLNR